jgi:hypothetical protein
LLVFKIGVFFKDCIPICAMVKKILVASEQNNTNDQNNTYLT